LNVRGNWLDRWGPSWDGEPNEWKPTDLRRKSRNLTLPYHMKHLIICCTLLASFTLGIPDADAKPKHHHNKHSDRDRDHDHDRHRDYDRHYSGRHKTRTLYFIERNRPVRRVVYVNPGGGYYRIIGGRRVVVRDRYYTSYPSRYYYPDGRRRVGVSFSF
jgi:hypothetical protein